MSRSEGVVWCDGCGVEIIWAPYRPVGVREQSNQDYCCENCFKGLSCRCGERMEMDDERRDASGLANGY